VIEAAVRAAAGVGPDLTAAVEALAAHLVRHMALEEDVVLPAARAQLTPADWAQADAAFAGNTDPRFAADTEHERRAMYARLVNLLPQH
jgi:hypothetical protein